MNMNNYRVAVLRGGPSTEYEVSMETGKSVLESLESSQYDPIDIIINRAGDWLVDGFVRAPENALSTIDVVFLALHGAYGEDGTVQRLLDRLAIPYTGSKAFASSVAMNKILTKKQVGHLDFKLGAHMKFIHEQTDVPRTVQAITDLFGPEYVVKPVSGGSSVDTYIANGIGELTQRINQILPKVGEVLVEERLKGREATVGVIERFRGQDIYAFPVVEIKTPVEASFYDYDYKYNDLTDLVCPGNFSQREKKILVSY